jgi:hypothetical protein
VDYESKREVKVAARELNWKNELARGKISEVTNQSS